MVKLTVLYNLPEGADHEAFVRWRTTEHQASNASRPGIIRTDFYIARETPMGPPKYKYITEAWYPDLATLERAFFSEEAQAKLAIDIKRLADPVFLVSEESVAAGELRSPEAARALGR
jgi:uncharacterized protein (TIGR02118 family)